MTIAPDAIAPDSLTPSAAAPPTWYLGLYLDRWPIVAVLLNSQTGAQHRLTPGNAVTGTLTTTATPHATPLATLPQWFSLAHEALNLGLVWQPTPDDWQPELQWSAQTTVSLRDIQQGLTQLLQTLTLADIPWQAADLAAPTLPPIFQQLAGVVLSQPPGASDAYRFNLRELVLATGLVTEPAQVFFVDAAIAALLAQLPTTHATAAAALPTAPTGKAGTLTAGATLVIYAGMTHSDLLLTHLPAQPHHLTHADCLRRSVAYGQESFAQDVFCQFFWPLMAQQSQGLPQLEPPLPGEPDLAVRDRLRQQLQATPFMAHLMPLADKLLHTLHTGGEGVLTLHAQHWPLPTRELENRVLMLYIQQLNRELNLLLTQSGIVAEAVRQVVVLGDLAQLPVVNRWCQQKLPNATVQSAGQAPTAIAQGLAQLTLYPQLVNSTEHQYGPLFLLRELVSGLPEPALPLSQIQQVLERRGINTAACQRTMLQLLEGQLPDGLVPTTGDRALLAPPSLNHPAYAALTKTPLFVKNGSLYQMPPATRDRLQDFFAQLLQDAQQTLLDPLPCVLQSTQFADAVG